MIRLATILWWVMVGSASYAEPLRIYVDADFSNHAESARSIEMGINTALSEVGYQIAGHHVEVVRKDHRANSLRSLRNMKQFLADDRALLVIGGMHSPPYIQNREFINENEVLLLVAWAAGGPITRHPDKNNWVFRLSIDDTKAGYRLGQFALEEKKCKTPHLLLEDTPWGKSNFATLSLYSQDQQGVDWPVTWFGWNTSFSQARTKVRDIMGKGSDCVIFVGNHLEGAQFARAQLSLTDSKSTIISHWGITGGTFQSDIDAMAREQLDLNFIQTCFSFLAEEQTAKSKSAFAQAQILYPDALKSLSDIPAPVGFIHAYDIGQIIIAALEDVKIKGSMKRSRLKLREALESLEDPVEGLVKTYQSPFARWSPQNPDAHEALGLQDICMARFDKQDNIVLHKD